MYYINTGMFTFVAFLLFSALLVFGSQMPFDVPAIAPDSIISSPPYSVHNLTHGTTFTISTYDTCNKTLTCGTFSGVNTPTGADWSGFSNRKSVIGNRCVCEVTYTGPTPSPSATFQITGICK